jgi:hypothetical protein
LRQKEENKGLKAEGNLSLSDSDLLDLLQELCELGHIRAGRISQSDGSKDALDLIAILEVLVELGKALEVQGTISTLNLVEAGLNLRLGEVNVQACQKLDDFVKIQLTISVLVSLLPSLLEEDRNRISTL